MADDKRLAAGTVAREGAPRGLGSANPKQGQRMSGAQALVASLEAEGVDILFGYPGGQAIRIYDALYDSRQLHHVLARHEQGAVHAADGYARATGNVGVALVTSGPGATNTVTGIATAYMDSIPLVVITGQVPRANIGTDSFQESDIVGMTMSVVKHSYLLQSAQDIARTLREAFHIAKTGRPGPVLVDVPSDILAAPVVFEYPDTVNIASYRPTYRGNAKQVRAAASLIAQARRPVLYVGGGVVSANASEEVTRLAREMRIPVVATLMAKGVVPSSDPLNLGAVGMHGSRFANRALNRADLIVACGARFSDRVTGKISEFAPDAAVIHIDIDPAEIGKVREAQVPIVGDVKRVVASLLEELEKDGVRPDTEQWLNLVGKWREESPIYAPARDRADEGGGACRLEDGQIVPELAIADLSCMLDPASTIVVTDVGQHQMWAAQFMQRELPRTFLSSGGLGTMGFGLPAALGAAIGCPGKTAVCITGDGSFQMNVQEMATATVNAVPVKVVLFDNRALGMVRQWQRLFYDGRYSETELADCPDFVKLAEAYGWGAERVADPSQVGQAFRRMLQAEGPYLVDVRIERDQSVFPMVAPGKGISQSMGAIDAAPGKAGAHAQHDDGQEAVRFSAHAPAEGPEIRCQGGATKEARDDR
ncbi:MAG TPA: biosynthetic-type acetolactate synthase large subunit [Eggerthellaceae bacterium]|nr:biosynthetic-type acetolactate synthase large subunit [Eggerthellaceae bacterium]